LNNTLNCTNTSSGIALHFKSQMPIPHVTPGFKSVLTSAVWPPVLQKSNNVRDVWKEHLTGSIAWNCWHDTWKLMHCSLT
jgi:hypothetical protein